MRLRTFGALAIMSDGDPAADNRVQRRQLALLAVLAAAGATGVTRDQLLALFWPDTDPARARHTLDQSLYIARRLAGANAVVTGPTGLVLDAAVLPSDVDDFQRAVERGDLATAAAAYTGPFLEGVYLSDAPEFERWVEGRRSYLQGALRQTLTRLAAAASAKGDFTSAADYLRRGAASDPLSGTAAHALILALANAGHVSAALDAGRVHAAMVREHLDAEPDPAVRQLMASLRSSTVGAPPAPGRPRDLPGTPATAQPLAPPVETAGPFPQPSPTRGWIEEHPRVALSLATVVALTLWTGVSLWRSAPHRAASLRGRTQVTTTGRISLPTLSRDGKTLAYATEACTAAGCTFGVEVQDVDGGTGHPVLDGASGVYRAQASPDGRYLLVEASINTIGGTFLVPARGGAPQLLPSGLANFFGNDSLLIGPKSPLSDSVIWVSVAGFNGIAHDSIRIAAPGARFFEGMLEIPGTPWFVVGVSNEVSLTSKSELRVMDRTGHEHGRTTARLGQLRASTDAIWLQLAAEFPNPNPSIVRIPFDARSGSISDVMDTIYAGALTGFDVTADGSKLIVDEGIAETSVFVLSLEEALRGAFAPDRQLLHSSAPLLAWLFPDGNRLLIQRDANAAGIRHWLSILPVTGGMESSVSVKGTLVDASLADSVTLALLEHDSAASHVAPRSRLVLEDVRTHVRRGEWSVPDSTTWMMDAVPGGGWAWVGQDLHSISVKFRGEPSPRVYAVPASFSVEGIVASPDGRHLAVMGWKDKPSDSVRVSVLSLPDGALVPWVTLYAEDYQLGWLSDGSISLCVNEPQNTWTIYRIRTPGHLERIGTIPRPIWQINTSGDLSRVAVLTRDYHGDAWMFRVVHP